MTSATGWLCPHCGGRDEQVLEVAPLIFVRGDEYERLRALFCGEIDEYRCLAAGKAPPTG